jgi:hypothetical protein
LGIQIVQRGSALRIEVVSNGVESVCRVPIFIVNVPQDGGGIDKSPRGLFDQMVD